MWINWCLWGILGLCHLGAVVMSFSIFSLFSFPLWICLRSVVFFYFFNSLLQWKMRGLLCLRSVSSFDFFNSLLMWKVSGPFYPRCLEWIQDIIFSFIFSNFVAVMAIWREFLRNIVAIHTQYLGLSDECLSLSFLLISVVIKEVVFLSFLPSFF